MKYPSGDDYTAVQRHPDDPFGDHPMPPFSREPAFGSPEAVEQAAKTIRGKLDTLRRGAHPESANGQLYNIALDLLRERDALLEESARLRGINDTHKMLDEVVAAQRDALADALLKIYPNLDIAELAATAEAALRLAGRQP